MSIEICPECDLLGYRTCDCLDAPEIPEDVAEELDRRRKDLEFAARLERHQNGMRTVLDRFEDL